MGKPQTSTQKINMENKNEFDFLLDAIISNKVIEFLPNKNSVKISSNKDEEVIIDLNDFDFEGKREAKEITLLLKEKKIAETYFYIINYGTGFPLKAQWEILVNSKKGVNIDSSEFIVELQTPYIFRGLREEPVIIQGSYDKMVEYVLSQKKLSDIFGKKIHVI